MMMIRHTTHTVIVFIVETVFWFGLLREILTTTVKKHLRLMGDATLVVNEIIISGTTTCPITVQLTLILRH